MCITLIATNRSSEQRTLVVTSALVRIDPANQSHASPIHHQRIQLADNQGELRPVEHQINVAEGDRVWRGYHGGLFKLFARVLVEETGQIFQTENSIVVDEDVTMTLVGRTRE